MKKLLALVLVTVMVLSSVASSLAISASEIAKVSNPDPYDYQGNPEDYHVDFYATDAVISADGGKATVNLSVKNNMGFGSFKLYVLYPPCLTVTETKAQASKRNLFDYKYILYSADEVTSGTNLTGYASGLEAADSHIDFSYNGLRIKELVDDYGYKWTSCFGSASQHYLTEDDWDEEVNYQEFVNFKDVDGTLIVLTFQYNEALNTTGETELPILLISSETDQTLNYGESGNSTGAYTASTYNGTITVPAQELGCDHASTHEVVVKEATCTEAGSKNIVCDVCGETVETVEIEALGHTESVIPAIDATCTEAGRTEGVECEVCGEILVAPEEIPATGHKNVYIDGCEPTCTEPGITKGVECEVCGTVIAAQEVIPALGHDYVAAVTAPTCTEDGYTTYTCSRCDYTYDDDVVDALGHEYIAINTVPATCEEPEVTTYACIRCGIEYDAETAPAAGHSYVAAVTDPTCTDKGYTTYTCSECGDTYVDDYVDALGHAYEAVVTAPTCTDKGYTTYTCKACGDTYVDDYVDAAGHAYEAVVTAPTCTEDGYTTYTCKVCGDTYVDEYVDALGHDWLQGETTGSCGEYGTVNYSCTRCDETRTEVGALIDHVWAEVSRTEPTCTEEGAINYECTKGCGETKCEPVAALGHDYAAVVTAPTCTDDGYTTYTCSRCGDSYISDVVDSLGHEYAVEVIAPTCTEVGYTTYTCAVCGDSYVSDIVDALGHTEEEIPAVAPTCTEAGLTAGVKCSVCGEILVAQEEVPALGHDEVALEGYEATCTEAGLTAGVKCAVCGEILVAQEVIPALGHSAEIIPGINPTCTEAGLTAGSRCTVCGEILEAQVEVPALGHVFGDWVVVVAPTQDEEGYAKRTCHCGEVETKILEKLPKVIFGLKIEPGFYASAADCSIDNNTRTITIVSKKNASEVDFRFLNSTYAYTFVENDDNVKTKLINGKYLEDGAADNSAYVRYFVAYAKAGLEQSYQIVVTKGSEELVYTVNVVFNYGPAVTGIEPGYYANKSLTTFDAETNTINVVSKAKAKTVDFRPLLAKGAYATLDEGSDAYAVQLVAGEYTNVTLSGGETKTQWKYFYCDKANGAEQSYTISVHQIDGTIVAYTVNVTFVD